MMKVRPFLAPFLALGLLAVATPLAAQDPNRPSDSPWKDSFYPFFPSLGNNFPLIALHLEERKAANYFARTPYDGLVSIDLGQGFTGARMAIARFHAPLMWRDWRFNGTLGTTRETRFGYFGIGNDTDYDDDLVTDDQPHFYEARRTRYFGNVELSRRVVGPLWLAGAFGVEHSNLGDLSDPSLFRTDFGTDNVTDTDVRGRVTLAVDLRDNEFNPANGLLAQGSFGTGSGGDGYNRVSADIRGYVSPREGTVVAARLAGSAMSRTAPLNARYEIPVWEGEQGVLGGAYSNRGLPFQRLVGRSVLMANAEIRHNLLDLGDFGAVTLLGFVDAGRVFEAEDFELTTEDMKVGAGGGIALRILRFSIWTFNFAGGPDGFQFSSGTGWSF
jgi:outer membrane protein assembly factor BamA